MDKPPTNTPELAAHRLLRSLAGGELPGWEAFAPSIRVQRVDRGGQVFDQGLVHPYVYVVRSGLLKLAYRTKNGDEWIKSFIGAGQFFASLSALSPGGVTSFVAEALDATELERIDFRELAVRAAASLPWQRAVSEGLLIYGARKEARERELLTLTPAARYRLLLDQSPGVEGRVLQRDLARYLGITPVSLSRLKARAKAG